MSDAAPAAAAAPGAPPAPTAAPARGRGRLLVVAALFVSTVTCVFGWRWWYADDISTDNASVEADVAPVAALVGGPILEVRVAEDARVAKGDVLVRIDPVEAEARVAQAEGEYAAARAQADAADAQQLVAEAAARGGLSTAQAQVNTTRASVGTAQAQLGGADASLERARSDRKKAEVDLARGEALLAADAATKEQIDALRTALDIARAGERMAESNRIGAEDALAVARSRVLEATGNLGASEPVDAKIASARASAALAHARVTTASAALDLARLALDRTEVRAPEDGTVSKLVARVGQVVAPGQQLGFLVPDESYVVANFKETQLEAVSAGQPVDVTLDMYPGLTLEGQVESVAPATGARFSALAPDNASGNFVKVVQRVPVRIRVAAPADGVVLRPGQSAVVTVHTGG